MKQTQNKDKFERSKTETVYLTLDEFAEMLGITIPKKKKKKDEKHNK